MERGEGVYSLQHALQHSETLAAELLAIVDKGARRATMYERFCAGGSTPWEGASSRMPRNSI